MEDFLEKMDNTTFALDSEPDKRDIQFEEVAGSVKIELPSKVLIDDNKILNQGATLLCVAFWTTAGINNELKLLWFKADKNPNALAWYIRNNLDKDIDKRGTYIIYWPKWARKLGWLEGYTQVNTLEEIKRSLAFGLSIATWTNKISWRATAKNKAVATPGKGGWHFINIAGYDDNKKVSLNWKEYKGVLIIENTWGQKWGDNWFYYLPYDYALNVLFNTKKSLAVNKNANRKYAEEILNNLKREQENKNVKPVIQKYEFYDKEDLAIKDEENKNLFRVLQNWLKKTGLKPNFRTIIGKNENRTNTRLLIEINNLRNGNRNIKAD